MVIIGSLYLEFIISGGEAGIRYKVPVITGNPIGIDTAQSVLVTVFGGIGEVEGCKFNRDEILLV